MEVKSKIDLMTVTSGTHPTCWTETIKKEELFYKPLKENIRTDVVIIGAGIAGVSVAYNLIKAGKHVVLIDDGAIGSGETSRTTAHLVTALDDRYFELQRIYGENFMKLAAESHNRAIDFVESTIRNENIDCEFERLTGYLFLDPSDEEASLPRELEAVKKTELQADVLGEVPGMKNQKGPCLRFMNQGQFHPLKYIKGLCDIIVAEGGMIFTSTHAKEISSEGVVTADGFVINASHIVVATNAPVANHSRIHLKQLPYRTYVIGATIRKDSVTRALWWDTGDHELNSEIPPYHYVRIERYNDTHDLVICGGEDHPTGIPEINNLSEEERYERLRIWTKERFDIENIVYQWSGQVMEPLDSLAFIGKNPGDDNIFIVTGDSGNGMTHGTIAGILIKDLIIGNVNPWIDLYDPSRFKVLTAAKTFFKELVNAAVDYIKFRETKEEEHQLKPGEAELITRDDHKFGVYLDETNYLHIVSAECTHLGCTIKWNKDEKTWDCPCHGSRFTHDGKVINGPSNMDLPYHKEPGPLMVKQNGEEKNEF